MNAPRLLVALAGLLVLVGALLHPMVPRAAEDQAALMQGSLVWAVAHWTLTFGQALAYVMLPALAAGRYASRMLSAGLAFGTTGTLLAATVLPAAAGDLELFGVLNVGVVAIGWMSLPLAGIGAILLASEVRRRERAMGTVALVLGAIAALAALGTMASYWATHQYVLRGGAVALGAGLLAWAWRWPLTAPASAARP